MQRAVRRQWILLSILLACCPRAATLKPASTMYLHLTPAPEVKVECGGDFREGLLQIDGTATNLACENNRPAIVYRWTARYDLVSSMISGFFRLILWDRQTREAWQLNGFGAVRWSYGREAHLQEIPRLGSLVLDESQTLSTIDAANHRLRKIWSPDNWSDIEFGEVAGVLQVGARPQNPLGKPDVRRLTIDMIPDGGPTTHETIDATGWLVPDFARGDRIIMLSSFHAVSGVVLEGNPPIPPPMARAYIYDRKTHQSRSLGHIEACIDGFEVMNCCGGPRYGFHVVWTANGKAPAFPPRPWGLPEPCIVYGVDEMTGNMMPYSRP
jgi:hypothetical protein